MKRYYIVMGIIVVVGIGAAILNLLLAGPHHRDQQKSNDLAALVQSISSYAIGNQALPGKLGNLDLDASLRGRISQYTYGVTSPGELLPLGRVNATTSVSPGTTVADYRLCANFEADTTKQSGSRPQSADDFTRHPRGYYCYNESTALN